jgi:hypothetical protein
MFKEIKIILILLAFFIPGCSSNDESYPGTARFTYSGNIVNICDVYFQAGLIEKDNKWECSLMSYPKKWKGKQKNRTSEDSPQLDILFYGATDNIKSINDLLNKEITAFGLNASFGDMNIQSGDKGTQVKILITKIDLENKKMYGKYYGSAISSYNSGYYEKLIAKANLENKKTDRSVISGLSDKQITIEDGEFEATITNKHSAWTKKSLLDN